MIRILFVIFLLIKFINTSKSQTEIGFEIGHQASIYFSTSNRLTSFPYLNRPSIKLGFFLEREITPSLGIRANLFYELRHSEFLSNRFLPFFYHTISLPIKAMFGPGKILRFGLGVEPMLLFPSIPSTNIPNKPSFHIGPCAEIAFKVRKVMRFAIYCHYDFVAIQYKSQGHFSDSVTNLMVGLSFAVRFKKMKKRRVIYSPG